MGNIKLEETLSDDSSKFHRESNGLREARVLHNVYEHEMKKQSQSHNGKTLFVGASYWDS